MGKTYIPGGFILLSRRLVESEIWDKPPMYLKVWIYILTKARHQTKGKFERGELLISIPELQDACSHKIGYRTVKPKKHEIDNILRWLRRASESEYGNDYENETNTTMITTTKTTRGMVVKVLNYNVYQDPKNYEYDNENDNEYDNATTTNTTMLRRSSDTIHKNVKNVKELKNVKNDNTTGSNIENETQEIFDFYQKNGFGVLNQYTASNLKSNIEQYGATIVLRALQESAMNNVYRYNYAKAIMTNWYNRNLRTLDDIEAYLNNQNQKHNDPPKKIIEEEQSDESWRDQLDDLFN